MKNKKNNVAFNLIFLLISLPAFSQDVSESTFPAARAIQQQSEYKPHVGFLAGAAVAEGSGQTSTELGFDIGYQPYIPFGLAAEYSYSEIDDGSTIQKRNSIWAKGTYNLGGTIPVIKDSYLGVGLGAILKSDGTSYAAAPLLGFDIPIRIENKIISVGAASRYAVVSDNDADTLLVSGVLKFWY